MNGMLELLLLPFVACLILTGIHCYLGIHIVSRGVIFVDLALAQVAALGSTVALLAGYELHSTEAYLIALGFTFVGAGLFALGRVRDESVPQEAIIGIVYAVSSAAAILVLDKAPHGEEAIKDMLVGSILFVTWPQILKISVIYLAVGLLHFLLRKKFLLISMNPSLARESGLWIRLWDFIFYVTFGFVVTSSVRVAGVLLVFSYLVVPAVCAMFFVRGVAGRLSIGWGLGFAASVLGLYASAKWDLPTGASVVTIFGIILAICAGAKCAVNMRHQTVDPTALKLRRAGQ
ncbi:MAG: metal ABC transporter permease [Sedimentisphaerales bacterium]|jgi:zinc/manganese transport system permease protein